MSGFQGLTSVTAGIAGAAGSASSLVSLAASVIDGDWLSELFPATWRGIEIKVRGESNTAGRRTAVHEYVGRDEVWVEDLGRAARPFDITAWVIGDDCHAKAKAMRTACEQRGPGQLVHPWLGTRTVSLVAPLECTTRPDLGAVVELRFQFMETGQPTYPSSATDTSATSQAASLGSLLASATTFASRIASYAAIGATVFQAGVDTMNSFVDQANALAADASLVTNAVTGLTPPDGTTYGRYADGARGTLLTGVSDTAGAIAAVVAARAVVATQGGLCLLAAAVAEQPANPVPPAVQGLTEAVRACCSDPADAVRLLQVLAAFQVPRVASAAPIGSAIAVLTSATGSVCRQAALASLALACADYQPDSSDAAAALLAQVAALFDAEILLVADLGLGVAYLALKTLRSAVVDDLNTRGAQLPNLITVTTAVPMPALVMAYQLYGDASRAKELTARSGAVTGMFLPCTFKALSR